MSSFNYSSHNEIAEHLKIAIQYCNADLMNSLLDGAKNNYYRGSNGYNTYYFKSYNTPYEYDPNEIDINYSKNSYNNNYNYNRSDIKKVDPLEFAILCRQKIQNNTDDSYKMDRIIGDLVSNFIYKPELDHLRLALYHNLSTYLITIILNSVYITPNELVINYSNNEITNLLINKLGYNLSSIHIDLNSIVNMKQVSRIEFDFFDLLVSKGYDFSKSNLKHNNIISSDIINTLIFYGFNISDFGWPPNESHNSPYALVSFIKSRGVNSFLHLSEEDKTNARLRWN